MEYNNTIQKSLNSILCRKFLLIKLLSSKGRCDQEEFFDMPAANRLD